MRTDAISNMGEGAAYNRVCEAILGAVERNLTAGRDFKIYFVIPDKCAPPFASRADSQESLCYPRLLVEQLVAQLIDDDDDDD